MTGFFASLSTRARSSIAAGCADGGTASTAGGASALIASIRNSVGTETKTGPFGAAIASWQARCTVCGRITLVLRPKLHFTQCSMRRAGPPTSVSSRSHWRPMTECVPSAKPIDSPASTTIGMRSCSAARTPIVA